MFKIVLVFMLAFPGVTPTVLLSPETFTTREDCLIRMVEQVPKQNKMIAESVPEGVKFRTMYRCLSPDEMEKSMESAAIIAQRFQANPSASVEELLKGFEKPKEKPVEGNDI